MTMSSPLRRAVEQRSAALLLWLRRLPTWAPLVVVIALVVAGLLIPGIVGAALLTVVLLFLVWLTYLAWPALSPSSRVLRLITLAIVAFVVVQRATG
jgi:hypothetical protein